MGIVRARCIRRVEGIEDRCDLRHELRRLVGHTAVIRTRHCNIIGCVRHVGPECVLVRVFCDRTRSFELVRIPIRDICEAFRFHCRKRRRRRVRGTSRRRVAARRIRRLEDCFCPPVIRPFC